jgi:CheY-like chemotaxis protein
MGDCFLLASTAYSHISPQRGTRSRSRVGAYEMVTTLVMVEPSLPEAPLLPRRNRDLDTLPERRSVPNTVVAVPGIHILPRVLVIAEGRSAQRSLQRLLVSDGYDVAGAANEAAGLELLRDDSPVAVVLDMHRRSSSAGWDVFR